MITVNNLFKKLLFLLLLSCSPDLSDDPIPFRPFDDVVLNLSLPENQNLATIGSMDIALRYPNAGVRGIIVYKKNTNTYLAFEKNCSFEPNSAGATVEIHSSTLYMHDASCGSSFNFDGTPTGGSAWRPLQQYKTSLSGSTLTITDEIVI